MMTHKSRSWFLLASLLCVVSAAQAQPAASAPDPASEAGKRAEGKARYERGAAAYTAGRFKDSVDLFLQADALAPSAALSFNIARAYDKLGDEAASLQWYRDFKRRAPDAPNAPEVEQRIRALEASLAKKGVQQLTVLSRPLGATVIVDERPMGVTPYTGQLPPGSHKIVLTLRGYADSEQKLDLPADHAQDLNVPLVPGGRAAPAAEGTAPGAAPTGESRVGAAPTPKADSKYQFGILPWVGLGAGVAALGGSLGFELARRSAEKAAKNDDTQISYQDEVDRARSRQTAARVLAVVGGALVVTGSTLLVIQLSSRGSSTETSARLGMGCLPGGCNVAVQGQF